MSIEWGSYICHRELTSSSDLSLELVVSSEHEYVV
jgi:hypothetical protein